MRRRGAGDNTAHTLPAGTAAKYEIIALKQNLVGVREKQLMSGAAAPGDNRRGAEDLQTDDCCWLFSSRIGVRSRVQRFGGRTGPGPAST